MEIGRISGAPGSIVIDLARRYSFSPLCCQSEVCLVETGGISGAENGTIASNDVYPVSTSHENSFTRRNELTNLTKGNVKHLQDGSPEEQ